MIVKSLQTFVQSSSICAPTSVAASARISRDGLSVPSSRLVPSAPVRPPNDLRAKMEATVLMSTCTRGYTGGWRRGLEVTWARSRRSISVGPRTESEQPALTQVTHSSTVLCKVAHGYRAFGAAAMLCLGSLYSNFKESPTSMDHVDIYLFIYNLYL